MGLKVPGRRGVVDIADSGFINNTGDGLRHDFDFRLGKLCPHAPTVRSQPSGAGEDNPDARWKRRGMSREVVVAITKGRLDFGPRGRIF